MLTGRRGSWRCSEERRSPDPGRKSILRVAAGAATLTACGLDKPVDLTVAALDKGLHVALGLRSQSENLLRGFCSHRCEQLLGGRPRGQELLLAPLLGLGEDPAGARLGLCDDLLSLLLRLVCDLGRCRVEPRLVNDGGTFGARLGSDALSFSARLCQNGVGLLRAFLGGPFAHPNRERSRLEVGVGSQLGATEGCLCLQARAFDQPLSVLLAFCHGALASLQGLLKLAGLPRRATLTKPLAHQLQVAVNLGRVIAAPDNSKVALHHVHRTRLALTGSGHRRLRSPVCGRLLPQEIHGPAI